jgi:hypothetical protein
VAPLRVGRKIRAIQRTEARRSSRELGLEASLGRFEERPLRGAKDPYSKLCIPVCRDGRPSVSEPSLRPRCRLSRCRERTADRHGEVVCLQAEQRGDLGSGGETLRPHDRCPEGVSAIFFHPCSLISPWARRFPN